MQPRPPFPAMHWMCIDINAGSHRHWSSNVGCKGRGQVFNAVTLMMLAPISIDYTSYMHIWLQMQLKQSLKCTSTAMNECVICRKS